MLLVAWHCSLPLACRERCSCYCSNSSSFRVQRQSAGADTAKCGDGATWRALHSSRPCCRGGGGLRRSFGRITLRAGLGGAFHLRSRHRQLKCFVLSSLLFPMLSFSQPAHIGSRQAGRLPVCLLHVMPQLGRRQNFSTSALQVSDTSAVYSVPEMAELLFGGEPSPAQCAAAHALLSADRTFFKQTARLPPAFQPRSADAVAARRAEEAAAREARRPSAAVPTVQHASQWLKSPEGLRPIPECLPACHAGVLFQLLKDIAPAQNVLSRASCLLLVCCRGQRRGRCSWPPSPAARRRATPR